MKTKSSITKTTNPTPLAGCLRTVCAVMLLVLLSLAPRVKATELLLNRSFDDNGANWMVDPLATTPFFSTPGEANLHGKGGYYGITLLWQNLDVASMGGAAATASITMHKVSAPSGNTIAVYLEYTVASGTTNRLLLLNPNNADVTTSTTFSTNFTVPAEAQRLVRFAVDKTYSGEFHAEEFSLDVVTSSSTPQLGLSIVVPTEGETNTAPFLLRAGVTNLTATVSSLVFCTNGVPVGEGRLDPHGEWLFADGTHLSVMGGGGYEMVDYSPPSPEPMFFMNGNFTSLTNFSGMFQHFPAGGGMVGGAVSILYRLNATGWLTAVIAGDVPLGVRTLNNGTNQSDTINYGFFWANAPAGNYAITARAVYGSGLSVTSAPVNITVTGSVPVVQPVLTLIPVASGNLGFQWDTTIGQTYRVLSTTNLANPDWLPVGDPIIATNSPTAISYPAGGEIQRFYRVVTP